MNTPGFTAEAAVYGSHTLTYSTACSTARALDASARGAVVAPQACTSIGPCRICVNFRIFPPRACVSVSCFGRTLINRCVP